MSIPKGSEVRTFEYPSTYLEKCAVRVLSEHLRWMHRSFYLDSQTAFLDRSGFWRDDRSSFAVTLNKVDLNLLSIFVRLHGFDVTPEFVISMRSIVPTEKILDDFPSACEFMQPLGPFPVEHENSILTHMAALITRHKPRFYNNEMLCMCMIPEVGSIRDVYVEYLQKNGYFCNYLKYTNCYCKKGTVAITCYHPKDDATPPPPYSKHETCSGCIIL